jgi:hypothetical protein
VALKLDSMGVVNDAIKNRVGEPMISCHCLERFKHRIREITRKAKGVSIKTTMEELASYMRGWRGYFGFCETPEVLIALTRWVRLRLRAALWRQWKTQRRRSSILVWYMLAQLLEPLAVGTPIPGGVGGAAS